LADEIKKCEMVEACSTYCGGGSAYKVMVGKAEGETRDHVKDRDGILILK
jgi:hypothetical protein